MIGSGLGKLPFGALLASAVLLSCGSPAAAQEQLGSPALPGFVVGHEAENPQQMIREEIPNGESVQDWTRMVTTQRFSRSMTQATPSEFIAIVSDGLARACPGATTTQPVTAQRGGFASAQFRANCPLNPATGKPETFIMLVIAGRENLHVKQVAFRRVPTSADVAWSDGFLAEVRLCETADCGA